MQPKLQIFGSDQLQDLLAIARSSPRLRKNLNIHPKLDDPIQRMFNVMHPGAYFRPHRHPGNHRWELFIALSGSVAILLFDDEGKVIERKEIVGGSPTKPAVVEIPPLAWHALVVLAPDTILVEFKPGPYIALEDKDFAPWAPPEGNEACHAYEQWMRDASP